MGEAVLKDVGNPDGDVTAQAPGAVGLWQPYHRAPRNGSVILVHEGTHSSAVKWEVYDAKTAAIAEEEGYWCYCDPLLAEVCPTGPETPFRWMHDPAAPAICEEILVGAASIANILESLGDALDGLARKGATAIRVLSADRDRLLSALQKIARHDVPPTEPFTGRLCGHGRSVDEDCNLCTASFARVTAEEGMK